MSRTWTLIACSLVFCGCLTSEEELDELDLRDGEEWVDELDGLDPYEDELMLEPILAEEPDATESTMGSHYAQTELERWAPAEAAELPPDEPSSAPPDEPKPKDIFSWGGSTSLKLPEKVGPGSSSNIKCSDCAP